MTEPTHHYRRDTEAQLDNLLRLASLQLAQGAVDEFRRDLRTALSAAWMNGATQGLMNRHEGQPAVRNPYDETDN